MTDLEFAVKYLEIRRMRENTTEQGIERRNRAERELTEICLEIIQGSAMGLYEETQYIESHAAQEATS